jgi:hypothetical protein
MGGPVGYRTENQNRRSALSAVAQANRRFSSPHPFGRAGLARFEPRRLVSTSERRLPGENVCISGTSAPTSR